MLMAAVASTSLGIDKVHTWPASSERAESTGASFAESFKGETPPPGKTQSPAPDQVKQVPAVESKASSSHANISLDAPVLNSKGSFGANEASKNQKESGNMIPVMPGVKKGVTPVASKASSNVPVGVIQSSGGLSGDANTDIPPEIPHSQPLSGPSRSEDDYAPKLTNGVTGENSLEIADGPIDLEAEAVAATKVPVADSFVQGVAGSKVEIPGLDMSQKTSAARGIVKEHDAPVKTEKPSKSARKADEKAVVVPSAVGVEMQTVVCAPAIANPLGVQQPGTGTAPDANVLSPILSSTSGRSAGVAGSAVATSKNSKESANVEKTDGDKMKTSGTPSTESAAPQKLDADTSKLGPAIADNTNGDKSKVQSVTALVTDSRQSHAVSGVLGSAVGDPAGRGLLHDAGAGAHIADAITHAVSSVQSGANNTDAAVPADLAHKTLMVTPTSLEVGVSNGTHGWLKIRAEMADGGAVNTSLSTSSSSGQEMLHRELPSLTAYLQGEHVAVNAIVVQPAIVGGTDLRNSFGGAGGGEHGQAQQSDGQGRERQQDATNIAPAPAGTGALYRGTGRDEALSSASYAGGGNWLSVRA
jgi:hypothetical protein